MNTKNLVSFGVFAACIVLASPVPAGTFTYQFICDLDGAAPFTDLEGGRAVLDSATGDLTVRLFGLLPDTAYTCRISCQFGKFADATCSTNSNGRLRASLPGLGRSGDLATGCGFPNVTVFADDPADAGDFCQNGYGQP
ncbi:MAG: hypothetical protein MN733_06260 [Nitrososphaera sp.]|nr:hypothetical protein [Nitrososphaera sp.]